MTARARLAVWVVAAATIATVPLEAQARDSVRFERVHFKPGTAAATIKGSVKGRASNVYTVTARKGQTLTVAMTSSNPSNYFMVAPPGADTAMFNSAGATAPFSATLATTGDYRITVYLMRNAARRGDVGNYVLSVGLGPQSTTGAPAPPVRPSP